MPLPIAAKEPHRDAGFSRAPHHATQQPVSSSSHQIQDEHSHYYSITLKWALVLTGKDKPPTPG
ncbi:hypothetical protein E2C01_021184 [Portunus trituberculatus]|uniref:Uncharacterized protein n=1 Tax=Portunus trituberculatus TaxID=210409 RepID=A0A5B7E1Y7_PORTR|nr:hypothetical protein [Portunus trituberculatus]